MRTCAYDPRRNRWREISPFVVVRDDAVGAALGSSIMVLGGSSERDFHVYDSAQDTWSRQPPLPFDSSYQQSIEVAGMLWCYASDAHLQETFIYDPETRLWTAGPRLPFELIDRGGVPWHAGAFEVHGKFCIMAYFELTPGTVKYSAFVWDPARESWDEAQFPVPPVVSLIEAEQREFKAKPPTQANPWEKPLPYKDHGLTLETSDQQDCLFGNCDLELDLILAKYFVASLFKN